ncbi:MAG: hypothetical protein KGQ26_06595 [Rhodospirillales bacterium]|nr:hypothetical protein [Rhodospirillales bacterium]
MKRFKYFLVIPMIAALSACADNPPQTTTTSSETVQGVAPAEAPQAAPMQSDMPGTITTQTTHSETMPAQ